MGRAGDLRRWYAEHSPMMPEPRITISLREELIVVKGQGVKAEVESWLRAQRWVLSKAEEQIAREKAETGERSATNCRDVD